MGVKVTIQPSKGQGFEVKDHVSQVHMIIDQIHTFTCLNLKSYVQGYGITDHTVSIHIIAGQTGHGTLRHGVNS